jgi:hypothetical protein
MINIGINEIGDLSPAGERKAIQFIGEQTARVIESLKNYSDVIIRSAVTAKSAVIFAEIHMDTPEDIKACEITVKN